MNFLDYSNAWIKGELFEAAIIVFASIAILASALLFWKYGTTPAAKSLVLPLLAVGLISSASGIGMLWSNNQRLVEFESHYSQDAAGFIEAEKQRVEKFLPWYSQIKIAITVIFAIAMLIFLVTNNVILHGVGIGIILFGFSVLMIDHFSQARAETYYVQIEKALSHE